MPIFSDLDALSADAAQRFAEAALDAVRQRGKFVVALSGGSTPRRMHACLTAMPSGSIPWAQTHLMFGDDRFVPPTDDLSNERMARETLADHVQVASLDGMVRADTPAASADLYEALVRERLGSELALDLTLLGMGPDGHTASLFPGQISVHEKKRLVIGAIATMSVRDRVTMTPPLLNNSREILFLVAGADKAAPLKRVLEGDENWDETPTQAIARYARNVTWLIDEAAAANLSPETRARIS